MFCSRFSFCFIEVWTRLWGKRDLCAWLDLKKALRKFATLLFCLRRNYWNLIWNEMKLEQYLDIIDDVTKKNYISTLNILNQKLVKMGILRLFSNKLMAMLKLNFKSRSFHHICLTLGSTGFHIVPTYKKLPQNLCHTPHYQLLEELITVTVILQG